VVCHGEQKVAEEPRAPAAVAVVGAHDEQV
jgi:hypothetical protein